MVKKEKQIVMEIILNDLKYLSVRHLYIDWFFNSGAEAANQLIDSVIKIYLKSTNREDLIKKIRSWRGNETHNTVGIIEMIIDKLALDFEFEKHKNVLENIYKIYQNRYLDIDLLKNTGACETFLRDLDTIDYTYKYFRDKIEISDENKQEFLFNKLFFQGKDLKWGEDNISLYELFYRGNKHFKL